MTRSIHEVRILIKRLRALLWFARPALTSSGFSHAKASLRRTTRLLAASRDLAATRLTLKKLTQMTVDPRDRKVLAEVSRAVEKSALDGRESGKSLRPLLRRVVALLLDCSDEIGRSAAASHAWPAPSDRVARAFRSSRKAEKKARREKKAVDFHEWRKKVKRLLYQLELTCAKPDRPTARTIRRVDRLQARLGDYHDCVVARERLGRKLLARPAAHRISALLKKRGKRMRKKARKIARSI